ncbi:hypothetical protein B0T17DRAFT_97356 [Bombardia bombarda]|uniref:Uncharacterized protein n=1 Tax=Bombardia bombarda TaxID=252184 RepID=A0AA39XPL0_9PEZI|nr:hypothetical protein B0T17DRAFT_97356 [Bombardia bombarda]
MPNPFLWTISTKSKAYDNPQHGWVACFGHAAPPRDTLWKVFYLITEVDPFNIDDLEWDWLPSVSVPAVKVQSRLELCLNQQQQRPIKCHKCKQWRFKRKKGAGSSLQLSSAPRYTASRDYLERHVGIGHGSMSNPDFGGRRT